MLFCISTVSVVCEMYRYIIDELAETQTQHATNARLELARVNSRSPPLNLIPPSHLIACSFIIPQLHTPVTCHSRAHRSVKAGVSITKHFSTNTTHQLSNNKFTS